ncbi:unnamed protein product [Larinioides sclopetarius]|uniref:Uncharacterized protein n=1 Tax=Larinioides sclopetarius TaxID=280406 RepID=A0AAV2B3D1_9ARAC
MEESEPSQLQGALRNYLNSRDSGYQCVSGNTEEYVIYVHLLKVTIFTLSGIAGLILIGINSKSYSDFFLYVAYFFTIWLCFAFLLFYKNVPWRYIVRLFRRNCCPWISPVVSADDRDIQTEEHTACQAAIEHNTTDNQTACHHAAQQDSSEEAEEQTAPFALRKYFPSGNIFRVFCCPRSCYSTVSTENLSIGTEEYTALHESEQSVHQLDRILEQTILVPLTMQDTSEVSAKLQIVEQRLLRYLLSNTEEQEFPSNE